MIQSCISYLSLRATDASAADGTYTLRDRSKAHASNFGKQR